MGRCRSRSRSLSRTPPRRKRYDDRRRSSYSHRDRRSPAPSGLLVRNVALHTRTEDLRAAFEKFGPVKDVYLPRNYYTGEPRGFGFVKFRYPDDAAEAKDRLNHTIIDGREIRIVYAEENRKTPQEMRKISRVSGRYGGRRRTPPRSPRRRYHSYSRSPSSGRHRSRSVSRSHSSRNDRDYESRRRSLSPREGSPSDGRGYRARERSQSPRNISPHDVEYKSRESYSPRNGPSHDEKYRLMRSPSSREISPHGRKDLRSSKRSISQRDESPRYADPNLKQKTLRSRDSSPDNDDRSRKRSLSPGDSSRRASGRRTSNGKSHGPKDLSPMDERDYRLNHGSPLDEGNGVSPRVARDFTSRRSISPRRNGGSVSPSRSQSYSPC